jgi:hypothetical protein
LFIFSLSATLRGGSAAARGAVELQRLPELKPQAAIDSGSTKFRTKPPPPT